VLNAKILFVFFDCLIFQNRISRCFDELKTLPVTIDSSVPMPFIPAYLPLDFLSENAAGLTESCDMSISCKIRCLRTGI
jgi:hypothetical protein